MLSFIQVRRESFLSPERLNSPTSYVSAPSSPNWNLVWEESKSQAADSLAFQTDWKGFMSASQESKGERRSEHHVTNSSSLTGSDFEFDLGVPNVADPPVSPKLIYSEHSSVPQTFSYSEYWTEKQVYTRQVPVLATVPRRSAPSHTVKELFAAETRDDASSRASLPPSPRSQRGDKKKQIGAAHIVGDAAEMKSPRTRTEQKCKSCPDVRIFRQSPRTSRVHNADEDLDPSDRFSDSPMSLLDLFSANEESSPPKNGKAEPTQNRKRWALKYLLRTSRRSSCDQPKTELVDNIRPRTSKSTPVTPEGARPRSPKMSPRPPMSPHEAHYKNQRAQWDEMKRKTTLPIKPGVLGCLGGGAVFVDLPGHRAFM